MIGISPKASVYGTVEIGENSRVDDFCILTGNIKIGRNVHVGAFSFLSGGQGIVINDYVGISQYTSIYTSSDDYSGRSMNNPTVPDEFKPFLDRGPVVICRHALLGAHVSILPGVVIGEGCSVGAFSLIKHDLEPWGVYCGVPAKRIRERAMDAIELEKIYEESICS